MLCHDIGPDDEFLILASDGVWEFIENDEAVAIVSDVFARGGTATAACMQLIARAAVQWKRFEGSQYRDDITAEVLFLRNVVTLLDSNALPAAAAS